MASGDTQVLFVPYRGSAPDKKPPGGISQQKHAAREYHRKAKLKRQTSNQNSQSPEPRSTPPSAAPKTICRSTSRSSTSSHENVELISRGPSPVSLLGAGRIDPFDSQPVKDLVPHAHEMVDYGDFIEYDIEYAADFYSHVLPMADLEFRQPRSQAD
jgi:hypothetical protein